MSPHTPPVNDSSAEHRLSLRHLREHTYLPDEQAPYHGVSHPDRVWAKAQLLMERCAAHDIPVDGDSLRNAVELHDALSHIPPRMLGHQNPERVAAALTFQFLVDCGYSEASASKVSNIVMATNPDVRPSTPEEIIMRAADLWNIGSSYNEFREASHALHREATLAKRSDIHFPKWMQGAFLYLERFMWPMLELTPEARDSAGRSVFHTNAMRNLVNLWQETLESSSVYAEFFPSGQIAPMATEPRCFYIAIHPDESARKEALGPLAKHAISSQGAAFVVPGDCRAFPLPDGLCSQVRCHDGSFDAFSEALRVTKPGGVIILDSTETVSPEVWQIAKSLRCFTGEPPSNEGAGKQLLIIKEPLL